MTDEPQQPNGTQDDDYAPSWRPEPGDKIAGQVTAIDALDLGYGLYPIVTLRTDDGSEIAVHAFHTVLRQNLARRHPKIGDRLSITYQGKKPSSGGGRGDYHSYRVTGGSSGGYDWDRELPDEERQQAGEARSAPPIDPAPAPEPAPSRPPAGAEFGDTPPF